MINSDWPYVKINIFTTAEANLYNILLNNINKLNRIIILPKVRIADIIGVIDEIDNHDTYLWKITNKHVDFTICDNTNFNTLCAIELDDYTHKEEHIKERDNFVNNLFKHVGIKLFRIGKPISSIRKADLIKINHYLNNLYAPKCALCGIKMQSKWNSKEEKYFYQCNCGETI